MVIYNFATALFVGKNHLFLLYTYRGEVNTMEVICIYKEEDDKDKDKNKEKEDDK